MGIKYQNISHFDDIKEVVYNTLQSVTKQRLEQLL